MKQQNQSLGETASHTETEDDDLHNHNNNVDDSHEYLSSPERNNHHQTIPRRFPRIGSLYQTRISKSTEPSDRPTPDRMSKDYPYISEVEEHKGKVKFNNTDTNNFGKG